MPSGKVAVLTSDQGLRRGAHHLVTLLDAAGAADPTFGQGGTFAPTAVAGAEWEGFLVSSMTVQADGKLLLVGETVAGEWPHDRSLTQVVRLTAAGQSDPTFGTNGRTTFDSAEPQRFSMRLDDSALVNERWYCRAGVAFATLGGFVTLSNYAEDDHWEGKRIITKRGVVISRWIPQP